MSAFSDSVIEVSPVEFLVLELRDLRGSQDGREEDGRFLSREGDPANASYI